MCVDTPCASILTEETCPTPRCVYVYDASTNDVVGGTGGLALGRCKAQPTCEAHPPDACPTTGAMYTMVGPGPRMDGRAPGEPSDARPAAFLGLEPRELSRPSGSRPRTPLRELARLRWVATGVGKFNDGPVRPGNALPAWPEQFLQIRAVT